MAGKGISGVLPLFLALPASGFDCKFAIDSAIVSLVWRWFLSAIWDFSAGSRYSRAVFVVPGAKLGFSGDLRE